MDLCSFTRLFTTEKKGKWWGKGHSKSRAAPKLLLLQQVFCVRALLCPAFLPPSHTLACAHAAGSLIMFGDFSLLFRKRPVWQEGAPLQSELLPSRSKERGSFDTENGMTNITCRHRERENACQLLFAHRFNGNQSFATPGKPFLLLLSQRGIFPFRRSPLSDTISVSRVSCNSSLPFSSSPPMKGKLQGALFVIGKRQAESVFFSLYAIGKAARRASPAAKLGPCSKPSLR